MKLSWPFALVLLVHAFHAAGEPVTVRSGEITAFISTDGSGFIDRLELAGMPVLTFQRQAPRKSVSRGVFCEEALGAAELVAAEVKVTGVESNKANASVTMQGQFVFAWGAIPFQTAIRSAEPETLAVIHSVTVPETAKGKLLKSMGFVLPLELGADARPVRVAIGGERRDEIWRLDMNDEQTWGWRLSDNRMRWPLWRAGGIYVRPGGSYEIWKSASVDMAPVVVERGLDSPGWLSMSGPEWTLTCEIADWGKSAPGLMRAFLEDQILKICVYPDRAALLPLEAGTPETPSRSDEAGLSPGMTRSFRFKLSVNRGRRSSAEMADLPYEVRLKIAQALGDRAGYVATDLVVPIRDMTPGEAIARSDIHTLAILGAYADWLIPNMVKELGISLPEWKREKFRELIPLIYQRLVEKYGTVGRERK